MEVPYFLSKYDPDPLRFYLTATAPETRDTESSWEDFVERNNNELVATWGNLANRMLSFAYKRFDGVVPEPGDLDDEDRALPAQVEARFETVGGLYNACKFRAAPSVPSGHAWARPTATHSLRSPRLCSGQAVQAWTARHHGFRSRRIPRPRRRRCM